MIRQARAYHACGTFRSKVSGSGQEYDWMVIVGGETKPGIFARTEVC